jgi:hypothetical protein
VLYTLPWVPGNRREEERENNHQQPGGKGDRDTSDRFATSGMMCRGAHEEESHRADAGLTQRIQSVGRPWERSGRRPLKKKKQP